MKTVIFDLDNTLYDVEQYFTGAFDHVSKYLSKKYRIDENKIYSNLMTAWKKETSMYLHLFDDVLKNFELENEVPNVVDIFNGYDGPLKPYDDVISILKILRQKSCKLGIVTDGLVKKQERKIRSLGIKNYFDEITFTKEFDSPKPSPVSFQKILEKLKEESQNSYYVGDNPSLDFKGAKEIGMTTVRILRGEFKHIPSKNDVDFEIKNFSELVKVVNA